MEQQTFDTLTRALATGSTRRRVLGLLTGGLAVAFGGGKAALAQGNAGGNSACAALCQELYPPGADRGECIAAGAHGEGPCAEPEQCIGVPISSSPLKTITFAPTGEPDYCSVIVNLTGYAGCTTYAAELYRRYRQQPEKMGDVTLGPTDPSGSLVQSVTSYAKGGQLDVRIDGVASGWTAVDC